MNKENGKELKINKILIIMAVVSSILAISIIVLPCLNRAKIETLVNSSKQMEHNYTTTTESNTWDISKNGDGSVIATLDENLLLTIAGSGAMEEWWRSDSVPWDNVREKIKNVKIENGVTSIGNTAFYNCINLTSIEIPESVTSIGSHVFFKCTSLTSIKIPEGVPSIGSCAFYNCKSLTSIEIPESVTSIGEEAFQSCESLTSIEIPKGVTNIEEDAFYWCTGLTNIEVDTNNKKYCDEKGVLYTKDKKKIIKYPAGKMETKYTIINGATSIEDKAFWDCKNLTSIEIPESLTSIGSLAFGSCLIRIEVDANNEKYCDENGVLYTKDKKQIIQYPAGKVEKAYTIINGVTSIGDRAFRFCKNLISIEIPASVTSIGDYAFYECTSLTSIEIPKSVPSIGNRVFYNCTSLTSIQIPASVTNIGTYAFYSCTSLTSIAIPKGVTSIETAAFAGCESLTSIEIQEGITNIGASAFSDCKSLIRIEIPESVTSIGYRAFGGCTNLNSIEIPSSVTSIGDDAFSFCTSLTSIEIPPSVTSIGESAFSYCQVTEVVTNNIIELPELIKRVQNESDILYSSEEFTLTNCIIEDGKIKISEGEAYGTIEINGGALDGLTYVITYTEWDISKNGDGSIVATLAENGLLTIIGSGKMKDGTPWYYVREKIKNVKIENGVTSIGAHAFHYCKTLTSIEIPESVTSIGSSAFYACESLTSIEIPESVTSIRSGAFRDCTSLTSMEIPASVTTIEDYAFAGCTSLTSIEVDANNEMYCAENGVLYRKDKKKIISYPAGKIETKYTIINGVTSIVNGAFSYCTNLTSIEIPESVTSIGSNVFRECTSLTSIEIPASVTSIGSSAFYACESLTSIEIPLGVTTIGDSAFVDCKSLISIEIPESITRIEDRAFFNCGSLTSIEIPESVTSIEDRAFSWCESLTNIKIPSSVIYIDENAFTLCESLTIFCKSGSVAETYAKEHVIYYQTDDIGPKIETTPATNTNPSKKIEVKINVTDEVAGVNEKSIKYLWSEENQSITKEQITKVCANGETIELKDVTGIYYLWIYAKDNVGNETVEKKGPFKLDKTAPTIEINQLTSTTYKIDEEKLMIKEIQPKATVGEIKNKIQGKMKFKIINAKGETVSNTSKVATGYKIKLEDNKEYTLVVTGDSNGDGETNIKDILAINKHRLNKAELVDEYLIAGDVNGDGKADIKDILQINKFRLGKISVL